MATEQQSFASGEPVTATTTATTTSTPAMGTAAATDLSAEIAATIEKDPGDRVRVTWIQGSNYRCNWWAPGSMAGYDNPGMAGLTVTTHVVRKSRFLTVTKTGGKLVIRDHSRSGTPASAGFRTIT